jgi:D-alanyl-D-alanine carboxypeptidase
MKRYIAPVGIALFGIALGFGAMYVYTQANHPKTQPKTTQQTTAPEQPAAPIQLRLPGADPIDAMGEDFKKPNSLWTVVSKQYPLTAQDYRPDDLQVLTTIPTRTDKSEEERSLRALVIPHLNDMLSSAKAAGHDLMVGSAFRSYTLQNTYYTNYVRTSGEAEANKYSAKPGQSEHQTGLVVDLSLTSRQCYLETCFGQTEAGKWLAANASSYGFILRYPENKTEITEYQYEPWHFRYVGAPLARALQQSKFTLDEAYPYLDAARTELVAAGKISAQ